MLITKSAFMYAVVEECLLPRAPGNCAEKYPRWFFDQSVNRCAPFYYTGCGGNTNNFLTRDICEKFCPPRVGELSVLGHSMSKKFTKYYFFSDFSLSRELVRVVWLL